jgi:hypothetical protein
MIELAEQRREPALVPLAEAVQPAGMVAGEIRLRHRSVLALLPGLRS